MADELTESALRYHRLPRPGKIEVVPTKPLATQRDLSLAYDYTAKGNMVAVVSNGTAVLGLGNLGAIASKPVMEGKIALFKRFADIDGIDLEIDSEGVDEVVNA
ncbi:MAG: NADP-dependent malic enzyme, partial [Reyranellales bacterium]